MNSAKQHWAVLGIGYMWKMNQSVSFALVIYGVLSAALLARSVWEADGLIDALATLGVDPLYDGVSGSLNVAWFDCLLFFLFGMKEPSGAINEVLMLNIAWVLLFLLVGFAACCSAGYKCTLPVALRCGGRKRQALIMLLWLVTVVLLLLAELAVIAYIVPAALGVLAQGDICSLSPYVQLLVGEEVSSLELADLGLMFVANAAWLIAAALGVAAFCTIAGRPLAMLLLLGLAVGSAYAPTAFPLLDYAMVARSAIFGSGLIEPLMSVFIAVVVDAAALLLLVVARMRAEWK